jgi:non-specific serine/threonine protein kinase/serine/threonine-protein kinase
LFHTDDKSTVAGFGAAGSAEEVRIGPYRLIREIGRGGMGTVLLAVRSDDAFQKRVAIKILKRGMDTEAIVRRFRTERQILASLEHPYIAGLLDGGTTADGLPYFAMEYVEGQPIDEYCDSRALDTTARLQLFGKICAAVQYAHQNLIIHRDIKPANVLVTAEGTPKLLDFGIAKLLNPELGGQTLAPTLEGLQLLTPEYASPEQVRGLPVTTATDVYSLGVLLYELLTGRRPYRITSRNPADVARIVCDSEPVRPSTAVTQIQDDSAPAEAVTQRARTAASHTSRFDRSRTVDADRLRKRLAGDLDTIVLKALSKEPSRRYASVDQFSEDIRRHLAGLPVIARNDTLTYRAAKFVRRNRTAVAAGILVLLTLIAGIAATAWQAREAGRARARSEQRFEDVRRLANASLFDLHDAIRDLPGSTPARQMLVSKGLEYLDRLARDAGDRPDLKRELAAAYVKVGDVQGRPLHPNLGDTTGALASYRKALAGYESLGAGSSPDPGLRREFATVYQRLSEVVGSTGDTSEALALARKALKLQREAAELASPASAPQPPDLQREIVASHTRVGDLLSATGDTNGAIEQRRLAVTLMERLAAAAPDDQGNIRQLGIAYFKLGNSLGNPNYPNAGDKAGALLHLERSYDLFRRATAAYPSNAVFRRNLAIAGSAVSDLLLALGRRDEALARQREVLGAVEALAAADPTNATARNDVAISLSKIGEILVESGRSAEAVREFARALEIHQGLAAADPANHTLKLEVAGDHNRIATAQANIGTRDAALANHTRAVTMTRELRAANPTNIELTMGLALALGGRADAYAAFARARPAPPGRASDMAAAERDYMEAVALLEGLQRSGALGGTDVATLENNRKQLERIRHERATLSSR